MKTRCYLIMGLMAVASFIAIALFGATLLLITPSTYAEELASVVGIPVTENKGLVRKTEGRYVIITKISTLFPDHAYVKIVVSDFVQKEGFPIELHSSLKELEKIRRIKTIDLIEENGTIIGIRGYADGVEILAARFP